MIAFLLDVWFAAFPFLLLAAGVSVLVGLHDGIQWFVRRGLRRRAERLGGHR